MTAKTCNICHTSIPENAPGGFCPACILRDADEPSATAPDAPSIEELSAAFPKLEILCLIGHGGMGFVYQARQPELDRMVAIKILAPTLRSDPAFEERFAREARVLGKLQHPNIVTLYEHGESGGFFYLMMEYIDGVNLRQAMSSGRFTPSQALAIVPAICDALQSAHAQGVWHRDIKPENILLDKDGRVKIADFGIARILGDPMRNFTLTRTGGMLGSAAYMAPEQHEKPHDVDHRADIYSLGVVIYEMLTGELPLGCFPAPSQRAGVNERIDEIVMRTLEKERELRQQSAEEVKTDVEGAPRNYDISGESSKTPLWPFMWTVAMVAAGMLLHFMAMSLHSIHETNAIVISIIGRLGIVTGFVITAFTAYVLKPSRLTAGLGVFVGLAVIVCVGLGHPRDILIVGLVFAAVVIWVMRGSKASDAPGIRQRQEPPESRHQSMGEVDLADAIREPLPQKSRRYPGWLKALNAIVVFLLLGIFGYWVFWNVKLSNDRMPLGYQKVEFNDGIEFAFVHPNAKTGGCSMSIPFRVTEKWVPESGQAIDLRNETSLWIRCRVNKAENEMVVAEVSSSLDRKKWESHEVSLNTGSPKQSVHFDNGTEVSVQLQLVGHEHPPTNLHSKSPEDEMKEILDTAKERNLEQDE